MSAMDPTVAEVEARTRAGVNAWPILGTVLGMTVFADFVCWSRPVGLGLGIFAFVLGACLLARRGRHPGWVTSILLGLSCVQTAIEVSFSNVLVLTAVLLWLAGDALFPELPVGAARLVESILNLFRAPFHWFVYGRAVIESPIALSASKMANGNNIARVARILLPGIGLAVCFAMVLSQGNAVLNSLFQHLALDLLQRFLSFDFSVQRWLFWTASATCLLGLLWRESAGRRVRAWTQGLPRWVRAHRREALWQTAFALLLLNALFFAVNTIDVFYLWRSAKPPGDVNFSQFLHAGVGSLIVAVVLSAVVLAVMFQQQHEVAGQRLLKGLGLLWVTQNLMLIFSIFLRLRFYIEAYQLTEKRIYVGCFLLLVITGFGLLTWSVWREKGLHWLISRNLQAAFSLFFVIQFADVAGMVASYNVRRWESNFSRSLDVNYLEELGPNAWPMLVRVSQNPERGREASEAAQRLQKLATIENARREKIDWPSWQARRDARVATVLGAINR